MDTLPEESTFNNQGHHTKSEKLSEHGTTTEDPHADSTLLPQHRAMLTASALSAEVIAARGYRSLTDAGELLSLGFTPKQARVPGLLLPLHTTDGTQPFSIYRPDHPRIVGEKVRKYENLSQQGVRVDCPPLCRDQLQDPKIPLWITEGQKKADSLVSHGQCAIALLGVWNFKGKNAFGGVTFLADFDHIAWNGRDVRIVFDNDTMRKPLVRKALERLTELLQRKGATVRAVYLPLEGPKGVDEYLVQHPSIPDLEALMEGPRPQPTPATVELLDSPPLTIRRPLSLIDGRAYAATWLYVKETRKESTDKAGNIVTLNPPVVTTAQRLFIVRDDGRIFGAGGDESLESLGLTVVLDADPPASRLWQTRAVNRYRTGTRPDPADVFHRIAATYDHYLDFSRSFANQEDMCSLSACLSLMTWLADAFDVLPYPWANGEWGSGKTKWGTIWASTSYLGQILTMGGSFAALRDLADYGATLLFDDAENIDDKQIDQDKKALLLAGNRRGAEIPLKEPSSDRTWKTRWVSAFCPRGFTAKKRPYGALETRSLLIPLIRTANAEKGNRDPARLEGWPVPQRELQDDLWALALLLLPEAKRVWGMLDKETALVGRSFEVWRAPLAVARLLEKHGATGLEATIRRTIAASTEEKREDSSDYTTKVVEAIAAIFFNVSDVSDIPDVSDIHTETVTFTADNVAKKIVELAGPEDDTSWATARRVGWVLSSLRIPKKKDTSTKKSTRLREVDLTLMLTLLRSYGLLSICMSETSGTSETSEEEEEFSADAREPETEEE